jgi:hypothetical protein
MKKTLTRFYVESAGIFEPLKALQDSIEIIERNSKRLNRAYQIIRKEGVYLGRLSGGLPFPQTYESFLLSKECLVCYVDKNLYNGGKFIAIRGEDYEEMDFVGRRLKLS